MPVLQRKASRQARGRTNTNWQNLMVEVYLNPGGWTDGRTDFGIVSGDQLALCSWKEPPPGQDARLNFIDATKGDGAITADNPIRQFLGGAGPSLKVYASYRTPHKRIKFTEPGGGGGDGKIRLEPLNDKYPPQEYDPDDISGLWPAVMRIEKLR